MNCTSPLPGCRSALELDAAYLQGLFLCVNGTSQQDVAKLVQAAQLVLSSQDSAGELRMAELPWCTCIHFCIRAPKRYAGNYDFLMPAARGGIESARVQVRAQNLLQLCFSALITNSSALGQHSQQDQNMPDSTSVSWHRLLELIIKITGDTHGRAAPLLLDILAYVHAVCDVMPCSNVHLLASCAAQFPASLLQR